MRYSCLKKMLASCVAVMALFASATAWSGVAVVVNPANGNALSAKEISRIFLGKRKSFPNGSQAIPVNQVEGSPIRAAFNSTVLKKSPQQIKAYWAQLLFTGKGTPPKDVSAAEVKKLVAENPNLIGYIDSADVDSSVKVVHQF